MNAYAPYPGRFTTREFERLGRERGWDGERIELLRGMIVKMNAKHIPHGKMQAKLTFALTERLKALATPLEVYPEVSVDFFDGFQPMPDIVVWDPAAAGDAVRAIPGNAVRLVVEVAASSVEIDLGPMAQDYAAAGLAEYWVVDVANRRLHRHAEPSAEGYRRTDVIAIADGFDSWTIPGLAITAGSI
jgi:Uma2 family endonuclease